MPDRRFPSTLDYQRFGLSRRHGVKTMSRAGGKAALNECFRQPEKAFSVEVLGAHLSWSKIHAHSAIADSVHGCIGCIDIGESPRTRDSGRYCL